MTCQKAISQKMPFKTFQKSSLFLPVLLVLLTLVNLSSARASNVFEIKNIFVDITAENATEARRLARREAEGKAMDIMLKRQLCQKVLSVKILSVMC